MTTGIVKVTADIRLTVLDPTQVNTFIEKFKEYYGNLLDEIDSDEDEVYIGLYESAEYTYYPGCYTLSNGDPGYPDEWDSDLELYDKDVVYEIIQDVEHKSGIEVEIDRVYFDFVED